MKTKHSPFSTDASNTSLINEILSTLKATTDARHDYLESVLSQLDDRLRQLEVTTLNLRND